MRAPSKRASRCARSSSALRDLTARAYVFPKSELFPNGGVSPGFHGASHHQEDPVQVRRYADINRYHVSTLAYFAEKLRSIPDGDGTLLDHSLIMYGSNMGNSNQHQHFDVPHILVGGANGQLPGIQSEDDLRRKDCLHLLDIGVRVAEIAEDVSAAAHNSPARGPTRR